MLVRLINSVVLFTVEKPWLLPHPRYFDRGLLKGSMKQGIGLFVISASAMGIFQIDKVIIAHFLGQDQVTHYSVVYRPFMLVFSFYQMFLAPLWPAHGEALRRGEVEWTKRALRISVTAGCCAVAACGGVMLLFGDPILRIWTRGAVTHAPTSLVLALTSLFVLWTWMSSISVLLNAAGVLRVQMWIIASHAALNVIVALLLVKPFGVEGVAWSMSITGLLTSVWGYPYVLRRHIYSRKQAAAA
jgi:O-antigen/teichoic acid export membrane protein